MSAEVSVCIPTWRGAAFIGATIESVLAQTHGDFELLIVDDNSPDDTHAVVARYTDPRIRYVRNDSNRGAEGNWNRCIELARGRYFKLLPHDDLLAPDCLQSQVAVLKDDVRRSVALVFGMRRIVDARGRHIIDRKPLRTPPGVIDGERLVRRCVRAGGNLIGEPGNGLARSDDVHALGRFDGRYPYVIDLDFWFRLLMRGCAHYTGRWSSTFRVMPTSWSVAIGRRQHADFDGLMRRARSEYGFPIGATDLLIGKAASRASTALRQLIYATAFR